MSNKPYQEPHPDPWWDYGYYEAELRYRFQCFEDEPWFKPMVVAFCRERDAGEYGGQEILQGLEETAKQCGIEIIARECGECEEPKESVSGDLLICIECLAQNEIYKRRREVEDKLAKEVWERMTPEERAREREKEVMYLDGLTTRDVQ